MATYNIQTEQSFSVTYEVEADSPQEAWETLLFGSINEAECVDQAPGEIIGDFDTSYVGLDSEAYIGLDADTLD